MEMSSLARLINRESVAMKLPQLASLRFATNSSSKTPQYLKYGRQFECPVTDVRLRLKLSICIIFNCVTDEDPGPKFLRKNNRQLLQSLTRLDIEKIFQARPTMSNGFSYHFLTRSEVKAKFEGSLRQARRMLQMPPIVKEENDHIEVLTRDAALQGLETSRLIIADISFNIKDSDRTILVRQTDGTLETAPPDVRRRINQTYFPMDGRKVIVPKMFEDEHLKRCLDEGNYEFVLNRACIQFEPYDKDYHRVTATTYQHINEHSAFDVLRSTRHFGPMAFFLAWHRIIDNLLIDCIRRDYMRNAVEAICLSNNLNGIAYDTSILQQLKKYPERNNEFYYRKMLESSDDTSANEEKVRFDIEKTVGKTSDDIKVDTTCSAFISEYAKTSSDQRSELKAALNTYKEHMNEKIELIEGLHKAHGVSL